MVLKQDFPIYVSLKVRTNIFRDDKCTFGKFGNLFIHFFLGVCYAFLNPCDKQVCCHQVPDLSAQRSFSQNLPKFLQCVTHNCSNESMASVLGACDLGVR